ncbi:hypothetical protein LMC00_02690 [Limosilactobacillus reuteri]|uniref:hypothetical protein n=1 Tax=Limosilactobacillus reuteri TaxID=1598 RepID=UPI001E286297|nr:hypothetical protein [Limosilactobacillus reuteri]MCC4394860.1 hypothetical protein [Limosilactobacillus reuteri]MCC4402306.1 hypothetical protein [Limosilactobacillus reuteri]
MSEDEIKHPLATLMKQKYGVTKQSSLRLNSDDSLFVVFRKIANYIYKNGEWNDQDYADAIKSYLENTDRGNTDKREIASIVKDPGGQQVLRTNRNTYTINYKDENSKKLYFILDQDNKSWSHQGDNYYKVYDPNVTWVIGNQNYTLGYGKLLNDLMQEWQSTKQEVPLDEFKAQLYRLTSHKYAKKSWQTRFQETALGNLSYQEFMTMTEPIIENAENLSGKDLERLKMISRHFKSSALQNNNELMKQYLGHRISLSTWQAAYEKNQINRFIKNYLERTYNIVRQQRYEKDLDKQTHAKSWETKKNIDKATQQIMDRSSLHQYFSKIELDNDVDLKAFGYFEDEVKRLMSRMPLADNKNVLRLRKLGNHRALGMYIPSLDTIVLEFRKQSEVRIASYSDTVGIRSFIHEYGHYLDYHLSKLPLSLENNFKPLITQYASNLAEFNLPDRKVEYLTTPTEVFARGFELWSYESAKLRGNLIGREMEYSAVEYQAFDSGLRERLFNYFDQIPQLKEVKPELAIDTSQFEKVKPLETKEDLNDAHVLKDLSVKALQRWTDNSEKLEQLISVTGTSMQMNNPNRLLALDQLQLEKLPIMVPAQELKQLKMTPDQEIHKVRGFVQKSNKHWVSSEMYSLPDLLKQAKGDLELTKQLKALDKPQKQYNQEKVTKLLDQTSLKFKNSDNTITKAFKRAERYILLDSLSGQVNRQPFRFTNEERELLNKAVPELLKVMYLRVTEAASKEEKNLRTKLQPTISKNISLPLNRSKTIKH